MKFNKEIKEFAEKHIYINQTRLDNAKDKVSESTSGSLVSYIKNNIDGNYLLSMPYQGSFSYHTIIKPHPDNEEGKYDVDVAIKLKYNSNRDKNEKEYYNLIYNCLKKSDRYKNKTSNSKERSIRVEFDSNDGEFYADLVPMFQKDGNRYVINHKDNKIEVSGGSLFRDRINEEDSKTSVEGSTEKFLKKIIRIYKFFRNEGHIPHIRSVQLTLLLTRQVNKLNADAFLDISSTLYHISQKLKEELELCDALSDLDLSNPKLPEEIFNRKFEEEEFQEFKEGTIELIDRIIKAYNEENEGNSLKLRQDIFGDNFNKKINKTYTLALFGHEEKPNQVGLTYTQKIQMIKIKCKYKFGNEKKWKGFEYKHHGKKLSPNSSLLFYTTNVPKDINGKILWQVTNNSLSSSKRGEINGPSINLGYNSLLGGFTIRESTKYKGDHRVQCRLINEQNIIIAESDKFYIKVT